jgi:hypothetical protein
MADNKEVLNRADSLMRPEGERAYGSSPLGGHPAGAAQQIPLRESPLGGRRRRAFVAAPAPPAEGPATQRPRTESVMPKLEEIDFAANLGIEDEDLPVLTEEVSAEAAVSEASSDRFDETLVAILISEIAHSIELQMKIELPMLVEASLMTATEELRAGISATMGVALRDFLARRQQLRLPLDEPNRRD